MDKKDVRISVITVTFNSASTLERTMQSVLDQTVAPAQYIIVDGLSQDDTVDIAKGFSERFKERGTELIIKSEADHGMYDAMNKGIAMASGDVIGIINSDDIYESEAIKTVADAYAKTGFDLFYADVRMLLPDGRSFVKHSRDRAYATSRDWNHPTTFIAKKMYDLYTYRNESIHDDYDLILRLKKAGAKVCVVNKVLADFSMNGVSHKRSIRSALTSIRDKYAIYRQNGYSRFYIFECIMVEAGKLIIG